MRMIAIVLFAASFVLGAEKARRIEDGASMHILSKSKDTTIYLDTAATLTSGVWFDLLKVPRYTGTDTVGVVTITHKDSSGSDTALVKLAWDVSYSLDANGNPENWAALDSLQAASDNGSEVSNRKLVTVTNDPVAIRFRVANDCGIEACNAGEKIEVTSVRLNRRIRGKQIH